MPREQERAEIEAIIQQDRLFGRATNYNSLSTKYGVPYYTVLGWRDAVILRSRLVSESGIGNLKVSADIHILSSRLRAHDAYSLVGLCRSP
jgi:hypothetical protein